MSAKPSNVVASGSIGRTAHHFIRFLYQHNANSSTATATRTSASQHSNNVTVTSFLKHMYCSLADIQSSAFRRDIRSDLSCEQLFLEPPHLRTSCTYDAALLSPETEKRSSTKLSRLPSTSQRCGLSPCPPALRKRLATSFHMSNCILHVATYSTTIFTCDSYQQPSLLTYACSLTLSSLPFCLHLLHVFEVQQCENSHPLHHSSPRFSRLSIGLDSRIPPPSSESAHARDRPPSPTTILSRLVPPTRLLPGFLLTGRASAAFRPSRPPTCWISLCSWMFAYKNVVGDVSSARYYACGKCCDVLRRFYLVYRF